MHSAADLRVDATQVGIAALGLAGTVRRHVVMAHPRRRYSGRDTLHHARAHVRSGRTDAAPEPADVDVARRQVRGEVGGAVVRRVEQSVDINKKTKEKLITKSYISFYINMSSQLIVTEIQFNYSPMIEIFKSV